MTEEVDCNEVMDGIFIGGVAALEAAAAGKLNVGDRVVRAVVNCAAEVDCTAEDGVQMRSLRLQDTPTQAIEDIFQSTIDWIASNRAKGDCVLVACQFGVSRSAAVCAGTCVPLVMRLLF